MNICELSETDRPAWEAYIQNSPYATPFQRLGWQQVFANVFKLKTCYYIAKDQGRVVGLLPLVLINSRLAGCYITSMSGGMLADDHQAAEALWHTARELMARYRATYLILRDSRYFWDLPGMETRQDHCTFLVPLPSDPEKLFRRLDRGTRKQLKQAWRAPMTCNTGTTCLDKFYPAYSMAMRERGTPTQGRQFFQYALEQMPEHFNLFVIEQGQQILGGGSVAYLKDRVYCAWAGMLREYYATRPNHLLYWEVLKYGCEKGYRSADLGRSLCHSGSYHFKLNWGAEPIPLYQQFYTNGRSKPPEVGANLTDEPTFQLFINLWKHVPLRVAERIGPRLRRSMPLG